MQRLVADAAGSGQYDETTRLTEIARALHGMAEELRSARTVTPPSAPEKTGSVSRKRESSPRRTLRKNDYPKFLRDGEYLVKVGWSKKYEEYSQRARFDQVAPIIEFLAATDGRQPVSPETILAVRDSEGEELPDYQAYLMLAWLRTEGLVERHGRDGYVVTDVDNLERRVSELRSALPDLRVAS